MSTVGFVSLNDDKRQRIKGQLTGIFFHAGGNFSFKMGILGLGPQVPRTPFICSCTMQYNTNNNYQSGLWLAPELYMELSLRHIDHHLLFAIIYYFLQRISK
jgi:hypothetical protein